MNVRQILPGLALAYGFSCQPGCNWRKPLPRERDAGPPVEILQGRPDAQSPNKSGVKVLQAAAVSFIDEHEPNDDADHAQPIPLIFGGSRGLRGSLAPPTALGAGKGADDWYTLTTPAGPAVQQLRIELASGPEADLQLDLYDRSRPGSLKAFGHMDDHGRGEAEQAILGVRAQQELLLRVRGNVATSAPELAAFNYQLVLSLAAAPFGSESEPNDTPEQANAATGPDLSGTLPWRGDEDFWVLNLDAALYRRPTGTLPGEAPTGLKSDAILRVELKTPGVSPSLRILLEPEAQSSADASSAGTSAFRKLKFLLDLSAPKGTTELRLRNIGLPAGTARAFIGVRTPSPPVFKGTLSPRYQLRLSVEPPLEDAESEPNDECSLEHSNLVAVSSKSGTAEASIAGFLWPGDVDCYRIHAADTPRRLAIQLALPGAGSDCRATLDWVSSPGVERLPDADAGTATLFLRARSEALVRVQNREHKTCFDAPYRLVVHSTANP